MMIDKLMKMSSIVIVLTYALISSLQLMILNRNILYRLIGSIVFVMVLWVGLQKETYLPFLGETALPVFLLKDFYKPPNANVNINLPFNFPDGTKIIYWGAKPSNNKIIEDPMKAYGDVSNSGITVVKDGLARVSVFCPTKYKVPWGKTLDRHIHYRVVINNLMIGPVRTVLVNC